MDARVRELEKGHAVVVERIGGLEKRMDQRFDEMMRQFNEVNRKIDKLPSEWGMARVVFYVVGTLMAAVIFGPRVISSLGAG